MGSKGVSQPNPQKSNPRFTADISDYSITCPGESSPGHALINNNGTTLNRDGTNLVTGLYPNILKE